ncbi:response regulator [Chondrinema litorale]|uniref:response regulator n=1 Tax=Chondrinema litorale TaxID=2994555 RepID=UPI002542C9B0|nr:response regulator [Chondrinema litorale]UZR97611.1 response regulator [Chondrinema litorale]
MKSKFDLVFLSDDDLDDIFLHKRKIEKFCFTEELFVYTNAKEALDYLRAAEENNSMFDYVLPEIIFLDINMPKMDGWMFLEAYGKLNEQIKSKIKIFMLSASSNIEEQNRAYYNNNITSFYSKPLTNEMLENIRQFVMSDML